ncbi:MAG: phosphatidate cytidylyltransferase [Oscillospiraceae bacterium]|nr:phosphatidate cytidylyltransferase [Oscillospiraceae bacterium]
MTTRIISAAVGVVITLLLLFLHNTIVFPIAIGLVTAILIFEFLRANELLRYRLSTIGALILAFSAAFFTDQSRLISRMRLMVCVVGVVCILIDYIRHQTKMSQKSFFAMIAGLFLIVLPMSSIVTLNHTHEQHGLALLLLGLGGAWIADSGAYFVGSSMGKHKLCPSISPNKTVEGFIGGIFFNVVYFVLFALIYSAICKRNGVGFAMDPFSAVIVAMVCAVLGTIGDLTASVMKRQLEIKDFGNLMPGHGGLLDRFDSVLLVLPFFCAYVQTIDFINLPH